jgi:hypothetical protein
VQDATPCMAPLPNAMHPRPALHHACATTAGKHPAGAAGPPACQSCLPLHHRRGHRLVAALAAHPLHHALVDLHIHAAESSGHLEQEAWGGARLLNSDLRRRERRGQEGQEGRGSVGAWGRAGLGRARQDGQERHDVKHCLPRQRHEGAPFPPLTTVYCSCWLLLTWMGPVQKSVFER